MHDYIVGRLSDDERRVFEDRLVRDPALVRELEESLRIREGLEQLRAKGYFAGTASSASRVRSPRFWLPALAAAAVAGLALFLSWEREIGPPPVLTESVGADVAPLVTEHLTFVSMRGDTTPVVDLPPVGVIAMRIEPETRPTDSRYRVTLTHRDHGGSANTVGVLSALALSSDGYVHCFVDASRLTAGSYLLRIEREAAGADPAEFAFNLRAVGNQPSQ